MENQNYHSQDNSAETSTDILEQIEQIEQEYQADILQAAHDGWDAGL